MSSDVRDSTQFPVHEKMSTLSYLKPQWEPEQLTFELTQSSINIGWCVYSEVFETGKLYFRAPLELLPQAPEANIVAGADTNR